MYSQRRNSSDSLIRRLRGRQLPRTFTQQEVSEGQAAVLRRLYGREKSPSVALSNASGTCERAARNHLSGAHSMNLKDFFNACQRIPELRGWGIRMMGGETHLDPSFEAELQGLFSAYHAICEQREAAHHD